MPCVPFKLPDGTVAIVKMAKQRFPRCRFCPQDRPFDPPLPATQLCDGVISKTLGGGEITCDAKVCTRCAQQIGEKDFCPKHRQGGN